jgi:uncharacterized protein
MSEHAGTGYMTTYTGRQLRYEAPTAEMICIEDIAHHLSMLCHWCGACREFLSVAQHSVLVSHLCPAELQPWALLHDAAEAYCGDMIRPLKVLMPQYREVEKNVLRVIVEKYGLSWPEPIELKAFDNRALAIESRALMHSSEALHDGRGTLIVFDDLPDDELHPLAPREVEHAFLTRFAELFVWGKS